MWPLNDDRYNFFRLGPVQQFWFITEKVVKIMLKHVWEKLNSKTHCNCTQNAMKVACTQIEHENSHDRSAYEDMSESNTDSTPHCPAIPRSWLHNNYTQRTEIRSAWSWLPAMGVIFHFRALLETYFYLIWYKINNMAYLSTIVMTLHHLTL